jgi:hypothetical protein
MGKKVTRQNQYFLHILFNNVYLMVFEALTQLILEKIAVHLGYESLIWVLNKEA